MINDKKNILRKQLGKRIQEKRLKDGLDLAALVNILNENQELLLTIKTLQKIENGMFTMPIVLHNRLNKYIKE